MPDISLIALIGGVPTTGLICAAYKASRFGALPVPYDTAAPGGAADATATSGSAFGGPGQVVLTVPTFEEYWISMPSGGHVAWVKSPSPVVPESDVTALVADLALKAPLASPTFTGVVTAPAAYFKGSPWFDVKAYGAVGDGVTDDSAAIQGAINAAKVAGGIVLLGAATYAIASTLTCILNGSTDKGVQILGEGVAFSPNSLTSRNPATTLKWTGGAGGTVLSVGNGHVDISAVQVDCNAGLANIGILATDLQHSHWADVLSYAPAVWAYKFLAHAAGCYENLFEHVGSAPGTGTGAGCLLDGDVSTYDCATSTWIGCAFHTRSSDPALDISSADNMTFVQLSLDAPASRTAAYFRAASGQRLGASSISIFGVSGQGNIIHDAAANNGIFGLDYSNGFLTPTGATVGARLQVLGSSLGVTTLARPAAGVGPSLYIGDTATSGFTNANIGISIRDASSAGVRLERIGQVGYEVYVATDNLLHLGGPNATVDTSGRAILAGGLAATSSSALNGLQLTDAGTYGPNIKLIAGGPNPNKSIRVNTGTGDFEIVNNGYAAVILGLTDAGLLTPAGGLSVPDAKDVALATTTGTKIGTATDQKLAFHNSTPVIQRAGAAQVAAATTAPTNTTPYGYTTSAQAAAVITLLNEIRAALVEKGIIKGAA